MPDLSEIRSALARIPNPIAVLESLFQRAPVGLQIYEAGGRSLLVNQAFLELFGSAPPPEYNVLRDEIAAKNGVLGLVQRAFKGETISTPTVWYDPRELTQVKVEKGNRVAIQATFFPLFDGAGSVSHVCILFKDLTAEQVQRELLEEERELLSAIVDQVSEGVLMADAAGVLRIVNRAARELGIRPGMPIEPDLTLSRALRGETASAIVERQAPDGSTRALAAVGVPLRRGDGTLRGAVATFRDETERVMREKEAEQTAHFRERFIGVLGHDLRSPLTAIKGSAQILLRQRDLEDRVLASAARINASAERMGRMIADLLDFTQARLGGGLAVTRKPTDLGAVAKTAVEEALAANPDREVLLSVEGDAQGAFDSDRIAQLLGNLLVNALAYGPPREPVRVSVTGHEQTVEITVENGGAEIAEADREALFDPFRRGSNRTTRGLGLGLFIVQQIARAHGGDVRVESSPDRTVFAATLQR